MKTIKYLLFCVETITLILVFIFGIACAESESWFLAIICITAPFLYGRAVNIDKHFEFAEAYEKERLNG